MAVQRQIRSTTQTSMVLNIARLKGRLRKPAYKICAPDPVNKASLPPKAAETPPWAYHYLLAPAVSLPSPIALRPILGKSKISTVRPLTAITPRSRNRSNIRDTVSAVSPR